MIKFTNFFLLLSALMFFFGDITKTRGFGIWGIMFMLIAVIPVFLIAFRGKS